MSAVNKEVSASSRSVSFLNSTAVSDEVLLEKNASPAAWVTTKETKIQSRGWYKMLRYKLFNNSRRKKELSFYVITNNSELRTK